MVVPSAETDCICVQKWHQAKERRRLLQRLVCSVVHVLTQGCHSITVDVKCSCQCFNVCAVIARFICASYCLCLWISVLLANVGIIKCWSIGKKWVRIRLVHQSKALYHACFICGPRCKMWSHRPNRLRQWFQISFTFKFKLIPLQYFYVLGLRVQYALIVSKRSNIDCRFEET